MRLILLLFDSLNRRALECYGGTTVRTPNFPRLAERAVRFERHYVGSMPCMPARRDMHTGRLNFLHRGWGPLEPFDNSFPEILGEAGIYSPPGLRPLPLLRGRRRTYHQRYNSFEFVRGQEARQVAGDGPPAARAFAEITTPEQFEADRAGFRLQHMINRESSARRRTSRSVQCFARSFEFLEPTGREDNWLLQLETFDPHEPFHAPARFRKDYPTDYGGPVLDWPRYRRVLDRPDEIAELRANYAALVAMCDHYLGRLLDYMDAHDLWRDTALILTTDHGFLLAEHDWWGKNRMPFYDEIAHIPLLSGTRTMRPRPARAARR